MAAKKKAPSAPTTNGMPATTPAAKEPSLPRMTKVQLEQRVRDLEGQVARLKAELEEIRGPQVPWWQKIAGSFADDPAFDEAMHWARVAGVVPTQAWEEVSKGEVVGWSFLIRMSSRCCNGRSR